MKLNVGVKYIQESAETKKAGFFGDVVQLSSELDFKLSDQAISIPSSLESNANDSVKVMIWLVGTTKSNLPIPALVPQRQERKLLNPAPRRFRQKSEQLRSSKMEHLLLEECSPTMAHQRNCNQQTIDRLSPSSC
jgi:hypothetical protein